MKLSMMYEASIDRAVADAMALIRSGRYKPAAVIPRIARRYGIERSELARAMSAHAKTKIRPKQEIIQPAEPELPKMVQGTLF